MKYPQKTSLFKKLIARKKKGIVFQILNTNELINKQRSRGTNEITNKQRYNQKN